MFLKMLLVCFLVVLLLVSSGCVAVLAGAGGTALWQGGKVISEERGPMTRTVSAVEAAFRAKNITLKDKVTKNEVTQLRGENASHTKVAVDVFDTGPKNVRIEIRFGLGEKIPARDLLDEIKKRL